jgi:hypothetical protein
LENMETPNVLNGQMKKKMETSISNRGHFCIFVFLNYVFYFRRSSSR